MKNLTLATSVFALLLGFSCCGSSSGGGAPTPNNNIYNLRTINTLTGISALLKGGYSNGTKGSLSIVRLDDGSDILNGIPVKKIKYNASITLDNGYSSQDSSVSSVDGNGFTLAVNDGSTHCKLTTNKQVVPTDAKIGATSSTTAIYSCDDSTNRTMSWSLSDAGNGNANYIFKTVISSASQSENTETVTITPQNKIIHYKIYVNVIAQDVTVSFEGDVN